ncbi:MAG: ferredoxin [Bacteroidales bacterium 55_9]|nr:MAG: ferredoxin [Bacteroidales bacterium 55_9]
MKKSVIMAMTLFFAAAATTAGAQTTEEADKRPAVYFIEEITPENLVRIYEALGRKAEGRVAVKVSTGEPGGHNFLQPTLIAADLVHKVGGTIVECNTAYGGGRSDTENHLKAAADHGFTSIADVDIMDADGEVALPVKGGRHLKEDFVGRNYLNYDFTVILSHFKGHAMGGFGGAIKNMSIGIASSKGKAWIHSAGKTKDQNKVWGDLPAQDDFLESMAEAAKAVADHCGDKILYISVANNLSVDCDCDSSPEDPKMGDIGILASLDPVALDKACVDMVRASKDHGKIHLIERIDSRHGMHTLDYGEKIGLGSQEYRLVRLDGK